LTGCFYHPNPVETIRNSECLYGNEIKVNQIMPNGIHAYLCVNDGCSRELFFIPYNEWKLNDAVDNQMVNIPNGKCFIKNGTYQYIAINGANTTIRKIKFIDSPYTIPNPDYKPENMYKIDWTSNIIFYGIYILGAAWIISFL
jgi:hypothetical protein